MFSAKADNTLQDLHNSSDRTKAECNNCFIVRSNNFQFKNELKLAYLDRYLVSLRSMAVLVGRAK